MCRYTYTTCTTAPFDACQISNNASHVLRELPSQIRSAIFHPTIHSDSLFLRWSIPDISPCQARLLYHDLIPVDGSLRTQGKEACWQEEKCLPIYQLFFLFFLLLLKIPSVSRGSMLPQLVPDSVYRLHWLFSISPQCVARLTITRFARLTDTSSLTNIIWLNCPGIISTDSLSLFFSFLPFFSTRCLPHFPKRSSSPSCCFSWFSVFFRHVCHRGWQ